MDKIEIRYDKKKLLTAIGLIALPLLIATVLVFFTDIFDSNEGLTTLKGLFEVALVVADIYLIYIIYKKRGRFGDSPALILTNDSIDINEDGNWTSFKWVDNLTVNVVNKKVGEREIEVLLVADKNKTKEINIFPLDKKADEIRGILKRLS
jgi:hypothetical protein